MLFRTQSKVLLWFSQIDPKTSLFLIQLKISRPRPVQLNHPKIFLMLIPVKGLLWFSQINLKISLMLIPLKTFQDLDRFS